eukprot:54717-Amorphochlora_amoeboformis.AAC.1
MAYPYPLPRLDRATDDSKKRVRTIMPGSLPVTVTFHGATGSCVCCWAQGILGEIYELERASRRAPCNPIDLTDPIRVGVDGSADRLRAWSGVSLSVGIRCILRAWGNVTGIMSARACT